LKFYKSFLNYNINTITCKEIFLCLGIGLCSIWWFIFLSFWPPLLWGAITFSNLFHFGWFLVHQMHQWEGFKFCLDTINNGAIPLDLACVECLSVIVSTQFAINEQLKDLTHMFCLQIPCYKLYIKILFFYVFTLKYMCHFGLNF